MKDYAYFLQDVKDEEGEVVFKKDRLYEILDENKNEIFVQITKNTNEVSIVPKSEENKLFICKWKLIFTRRGCELNAKLHIRLWIGKASKRTN